MLCFKSGGYANVHGGGTGACLLVSGKRPCLCCRYCPSGPRYPRNFIDVEHISYVHLMDCTTPLRDSMKVLRELLSPSQIRNISL